MLVDKPSPLSKYMGALFMLLVFSAISACSNDTTEQGAQAECSGDLQCPADQSCLQGSCVARNLSQCAFDYQCPSQAYQCVDGKCKHTEFDAGGDAGDQTPNNAPDSTDSPDTQPSGDTDLSAPRVISVTPADGASQVPTDTAITVTFSEPMDFTSLNLYSLVLQDGDSQTVETLIEYQSETHSALISPQSALRAGEGYRLAIRSGARDLNWNGVHPEVTTTFSTAYAEPAVYVELAEKWAPTLYQALGAGEFVGANIPTRIDFDQNLAAADNLAHAQNSPPAFVYYNVSESVQYYFLHYILYYPYRYDPEQTWRAEHDFVGLVVVVQKDNGKMLLAETVSLTQTAELTLAFKPDGSPAQVPGGDLGGRNLRAFAAEQLQGGTHFPLYVPAGLHEACHWHKSGLNGRCLHAVAQFPGGKTHGVVLRPGDDAQQLEQAATHTETGFRQMTYQLIPISTGMWALRGNYGTDGLFELSFPYQPQGENRPTGFRAEVALMLPKNLRSDAEKTFGRLPFTWLASAGENNQGQWLLDPVYILANRYNFGETVETEYCYNFFFRINAQSTNLPTACQAATSAP